MNGGFVEFDPAAELHAAHAELLDSLALLDAPFERGLAYFCSATRSQFYFDGKPGLWLLGCSCSRGQVQWPPPIFRTVTIKASTITRLIVSAMSRMMTLDIKTSKMIIAA